MTTFRGTRGDDTIDRSGDTAGDNFLLFRGGNDTVTGGSGNDIFRMGAALDAGDKLDGGTGKDAVLLNGDYSAGLVLDADTITNIEVMLFAAGHSYDITTNNGNVAAGEKLLVKGGSLGAGNTLTFDGSAEHDGKFYIIGGAGNDTLTGGTRHDVFNLSHGGSDTAHGGRGDDTFIMGGTFTSGDVIDGGAGNDTLELNGTYSNYTFAAGQLTSIDTLKLDAGHSYHLTSANDTAGAGDTLVVDFSALGPGSTVQFDGSAESGGAFHFVAGEGAVSLLGGGGNDIFDMTGGASGGTIKGNGGDDTVLFGADFNNFGTATIDGGGGNDTFELNGDFSTTLFLTDGLFNFEMFRFDGGHSYGDVVIGQATGDPDTTVDASQINTLFHLGLDAQAGGAAYTVEVGSGGMVSSQIGFDSTDTFVVTSEAALAASTLDAGGGTDTLVLSGDFAAGFTLGATITNFENITLEDGSTYSFATVDANVAAGATMIIDASALTGSNALFFSGANETDGHFAFIASAGADSISGGKLSDTFDLSLSNGAFVSGLDGNDTFTLTTATSLLNDSIDGGIGSDTLVLNGDFSGAVTTLTASNLTSIENLTLAGAANSYNIDVSGSISGSSALTVDASAAAQLTADFSAMTVAAHVTGSAGDDTIKFGANFTATDMIDGGAGSDTLVLNGGYPSSSGGYTFGPGQLTSVETLSLLGGREYDLITDDANVAAGKTLTVDLSHGGITDFNGSAETDGNFHFIIGSSQVDLRGGSGNDFFDMTNDISPGATLDGGGGNDTYLFGSNFAPLNVQIFDTSGDNTIEFNGDYGGLSIDPGSVAGMSTYRFDGGHTYGAVFLATGGAATVTIDTSQITTLFQITVSDDVPYTFEVGSGGMDATCQVPDNSDTFIVTSEGALAASSLNGGSGVDTLELNGDFSTLFTLSTTNIQNIDIVSLDAGHNYHLATVDSLVSSGDSLTFDGAALGASDSFIFNGSAESDGSFVIKGGAGNDTITGGAAGNTITGGGGADTLTAGTGADTFVYTAAADSAADTKAHADTVSGFDASADHFELPFAVTYEGAHTVASADDFGDLGSTANGFFNASQNDAVVLTVTSGALAGHSILLIDFNGDGQYSGASDLAIDITGYTGTMTGGDFI